MQSYVPNEIIVTTRDEMNVGWSQIPHYLDEPEAEASGSFVDYIDKGIKIDRRIESWLQTELRRKDMEEGDMEPYIYRVYGPRLEEKAALAEAEAPGFDAVKRKYGLSRTFKVMFKKPEGQPAGEESPRLNMIKLRRKLQVLVEEGTLEKVYLNDFIACCSNSAHAGSTDPWWLTAINLHRAWHAWPFLKDHDTLIGFVDSGINHDHDAFYNKIDDDNKYDFVHYERGLPQGYHPIEGDHKHRDRYPIDYCWHGTHCAGIAAAKPTSVPADLQLGVNTVVGVSPGSHILPMRALFGVEATGIDAPTAFGTVADIDSAIERAADTEATVLCLSFTHPEPDRFPAVKVAYEQNVCLIAATGNDFSQQAYYPAADPCVLAVGAVDELCEATDFSNWGEDQFGEFVVAPGVGIVSTSVARDEKYRAASGTSMAAAFVAGLAALLVVEVGPDFEVDTIYQLIRDNASHADDPNDHLGNGVIDVYKSICEARGGTWDEEENTCVEKDSKK